MVHVHFFNGLHRKSTQSVSTNTVWQQYLTSNLRNKISHRLVNQHWGQWQSQSGDTQIQARELITGPCLGIKYRLLSFNRMQSRVVTGLLTGHNTRGSQKIRFPIILPPNNLTQSDASLFTNYSLHCFSTQSTSLLMHLCNWEIHFSKPCQ
jgi:hypothetical protein